MRVFLEILGAVVAGIIWSGNALIGWKFYIPPYNIVKSGWLLIFLPNVAPMYGADFIYNWMKNNKYESKAILQSGDGHWNYCQ